MRAIVPKILAALVLTLIPVAVVAEDSRLASARQLVGLMRYDAQIAEALRQCKDATRTTLTPESFFQAQPMFFGGITPTSKYWPEVAEAFRTYYDEACSYMDPNRFVEITVRGYANALTEEQLTQAITFYSSALGETLAKASVAVGADFQRDAGARMAETTKVAYAKFVERIEAIVAKCRCDQK